MILSLTSRGGNSHVLHSLINCDVKMSNVSLFQPLFQNLKFIQQYEDCPITLKVFTRYFVTMNTEFISPSIGT